METVGIPYSGEVHKVEFGLQKRKSLLLVT